ncbi:MAG: HD domain-containing protein, partial [Dehalococcoidia bacterium]|nr:HD domain-containing protein [Dehalococcoidia bacterium]
LGDHYFTRMSHTLQVMQVARSISSALNLNEDLTEAMCLGHDLGHTPFGHLGEHVIAELTGSFRHNRQSVRIVETLENNGKGLNLSWEVRQGILRHSKGRDDIVGKASPDIDTLEAQVCKISDALAYINHDVGDAVRAGIITEKSLPASSLRVLGDTSSKRIDTLIRDIVQTSWAATGEIKTEGGGVPKIIMSEPVEKAANELREYLFQNVYLPSGDTTQAKHAEEILKLLFKYYMDYPNSIPEEFNIRGEPKQQTVVDYLSGMTDRYALRMAEKIAPGISKGMEQDPQWITGE